MHNTCSNSFYGQHLSHTAGAWILCQAIGLCAGKVAKCRPLFRQWISNSLLTNSVPWSLRILSSRLLTGSDLVNELKHSCWNDLSRLVLHRDKTSYYDIQILMSNSHPSNSEAIGKNSECRASWTWPNGQKRSILIQIDERWRWSFRTAKQHKPLQQENPHARVLFPKSITPKCTLTLTFWNCFWIHFSLV